MLGGIFIRPRAMTPVLRMPNLPKKDFERILKIAPTLAVDIVIVNGRGEFLLEKRTYPPKTGCWHIPGGFVGYDERLVDTAKRKTLEETGLRIRVEKYLGYYDDPRQDSRGYIVVHAFVARPVGGKLKHGGLKWFKTKPKWMGFPHQLKELKDAGLVR